MEIEGESSATGKTMQDIANSIEGKLFDTKEAEDDVEEVVSEDAEELPEDNDTDTIEDEDSEEADETEDEGEQTLADYLGVPEDRVIVGEDGKVSVNAIIDGETKSVDLKELVASYQIQGHVNNTSVALSNERKEFEAQRDSVSKDLESRFQGMDNLSKILEQQTVAEYNSIDWDKLRDTNPAEWTALRQEYAEKAQKIQKAQALIAEEGKRIFDEREKTNTESQQAYLKAEFDKMLVSNPSWTDEAKRESDISSMREFLTASYGFGDEDMSTVADHRLIKLIQDAKAYREGAKSAETKKVKAVPKFQKPSASRANASSLAKARAVKAKRAAVKRTGKVQDVADLLLDRM